MTVLFRALIAAAALMLVSGCQAVPAATQETEYFEGTRTEYMELMVECLREEGWDAGLTFNEYDGATVSIPNPEYTQHDAVFAAYGDCTERYPKPKQPETEDEVRAMFEDFWLPQYECLYAAGLLTEPAPTWDAFYETYLRLEANARPHGLLPVGLWGQAYRECPVDLERW